MKKSKHIFVLILLYTISNQLFCNFANAQPCDPTTPKFFMDLTGKPDSVWISPNIVRDAYCCGLSGIEKCIEFNVTLDINSVGIILNFASGALPPGALEYNDNCGAPVTIGTPMYLSGVGPHRIVFCKPGNNTNQYSITAIPRNINIPDANFKAALVGNSAINTNLDGEIQCTEATAYTGSISVPSASISDLTGIEEFTNITNLFCQDNSLTNLNLSTNTALTTVFCNNNALTTLTVSSSLTNINCGVNQLTSLDVSANTGLTNLSCSNNLITNLDVSANTALTYLDCNSNPFASGINISANTALTNFDCRYNQLTSLDISANTALTDFNCSNNLLTSLDVSTNTALVNLNCGYNQLTTLNVTACTSITSVACDNNYSLTSVISANPTLTFLNCSSCIIPNIDISGNTALTDFNCNYNQLTSLDVSSNVSLTSLSCGFNLISSLDLSNNTLLNLLYVGNNLMTSLDLSSNTSLVTLDCSNTPLTYLDVSNNTALTVLLCTGSQLLGMNIQNGNNVNFSNFSVTGNSGLTCILVDNTTYMNTNWSGAKDPGAVYSISCPCSMTATTSSTDASCFGVNNGTVSVTPSGGIPAYSYLWSPGGQVTATVSGLAAGDYSVTIIDAASCTTVSTVTVTQLTSPTFVVSLTVNSLPVSDGKVFLFKRNIINTRMDTIYDITLSSSSYTFANVIPGNYLIYFKPNTTTFPSTPGRFNGNVAFWENASLMLATCANTYTVNINATTIATTSGSGALSGKIVRGSGFGKTDNVGDPIPGVDISLEQNPGGIMLNQTQTNSNGEYSFTNIPYGGYRIKVSIPGTPQSAYHDVTIDNIEPTISDLIYTVDSNNIYPAQITGVNSITTNNKLFKVVPNPFKNEASIVLPNDWINTNNKTILVVITDISGKQVFNQAIENENRLIIKRDNLDKGLYFITIKNNERMQTQKIIIVD